MLVIRRRAGETVLIGGEIEIQVTSISRSRVSLAIKAPQHIAVTRGEVQLVAAENAAALGPESLDAVSAALARITGEPGILQTITQDRRSTESCPLRHSRSPESASSPVTSR